MRVWRFYLITEKNKLRKNMVKETIRDKYPLYAITNNKKKANEFMQTRDMNQFIMQSSKGISNDEWITFANRNRASVLEYHDLLTRKMDWTPECGITMVGLTETVNVLMTYAEYTSTGECSGEEGSIMSMSMLWEGGGDSFPDPSFFNEKIVDLLRDIGYPSQYKMFRGCNDPYYVPLTKDDDYSFGAFGPNKNYAYDELYIFIKEYGDMYK